MHITLTDSHVRYSDDSGCWTIFVFGRELPGRVAPGDELVCNDCAGNVSLTGTIADVGTVSGGGLAPDRAKLTVRRPSAVRLHSSSSKSRRRVTPSSL